jgi:HEAT repeat protein
MASNTQKNTPVSQPDMQQVIVLLSTLGREKDTTLAKLHAFDSNRLTNILTSILLSDNGMRYNAAEALLWLDPQRGIDIVLPLLDDPKADSDIRYHICGLLSMFGDERAVEPLVNRLQQDPDDNVRHIAAFALSKVGDTRALPALRKAQQDDDGTDFEGRPISEAVQKAIDNILARNLSS